MSIRSHCLCQRAGIAIPVISFMMFLAAAAVQATPTTITIQGKLTGTGGKALAGTRAWQVQFYDAATGGNALGSALTGTVAIPASGRFSFEVTPPGAALAAATLFYQLAIDSAATPDGTIDAADIFPNRVKVTSVMYAQKLALQGAGSGLDADMLDGNHASAFVTTAQLAARTVVWQAVTTSTQMQPNTGYVVNNATAMVTMILPNSPAVGDIVRVTGAGGGGWKVVSPMIGTKLYHSYPYSIRLEQLNISGDYSGSQTLGSTTQIRAVAISPDGKTRVSAVYNGIIYVQQAGNITWMGNLSSGGRNWLGVAASNSGGSNGGAVIAACVYGDYIYISGDQGQTWNPQQTDAYRNWNSIAISKDGIHLAATVTNGGLYTSNNGGATWTLRASAGNQWWRRVVIAADGVHLAATYTPNKVALSSDGGATWNVLTIPNAKQVTDLAMSPDTKHLAVSDYNGGPYNGGKLYTSHDGGATWNESSQAGLFGWNGIAISADGNRVVACASEYNGRIVISDDGGLTWSTRPDLVNQPWRGIAMTPDGLFALANQETNGGWEANLPPRATQTGTTLTGFVSGGAGSALELQYIGNNTYIPLSSSGMFCAQ